MWNTNEERKLNIGWMEWIYLCDKNEESAVVVVWPGSHVNNVKVIIIKVKDPPSEILAYTARLYRGGDETQRASLT